jgi:O-antigen biosynthesis protein
MRVTEKDVLSKMLEPSVLNKNRRSINSAQPLICSYLFSRNAEKLNIVVSVATKFPTFQFLLVSDCQPNDLFFHDHQKIPDNLFTINKSEQTRELIKSVDLLVFLEMYPENFDKTDNIINSQIPILYFAGKNKSEQQLSNRNSYVISEELNLDLFLLFVERFFDQDNDSVWETNKLDPISEATNSSDLTTIEPEAMMIEEQVEVEVNVNYSSEGAKLQEQGDLEGAIASYKKAINLRKNLPSWVYCSLLTCLNSLEKFDEAIEFGKQGIEICSEVENLYRLLGLAHNGNNNIEKVVESYTKAIDCKAEQPFWVYCALVEILTKQNVWDEASDIATKGIEIYPEKADIHYHYSVLLNKQEKVDDASKHLKLAIKFNPEHGDAYKLLGEILQYKQQWYESSCILQKAIEVKSDYIWSHYNLGEALIRQGKYDQAILAFQNALKLNPNSSNLVKVTDRIKFALVQKSEQDYLNDLTNKPNDAELYLGLANVFTHQSRLNKAVAFYEMALKIKPSHSLATIQLQQVLERKQRLYKAFDLSSPNSSYALWLKANSPQPDEIDWMPEIVNSFGYKPTISIIVPTYNPPEKFLRDMIQSVLDQVYPYWEMCIADDASTEKYVKQIIQEYAVKDHRIKVIFRKDNGHISAASNSALEIASGEFIGLLDHDDLLHPNALYEVASLLNQHPEADMIYSDEDLLEEGIGVRDPFFKPDWCPDNFLSKMYTCHFGVYRKDFIDKIGGFRLGYEGSQDYDLVLRLTEQTDKIFHIPKILGEFIRLQLLALHLLNFTVLKQQLKH